MPHRLLADLVLLVHAAFVGFVVFGLLLVVAGGLLRWGWVRDLRFRLVHLASIVVVVGLTWSGLGCPLTHLEGALRRRAGDADYAGGFIAHWVSRILFYEGPPWVFAVSYTAFAAAVVATWFLVPPRRGRSASDPSTDT